MLMRGTTATAAIRELAYFALTEEFGLCIAYLRTCRPLSQRSGFDPGVHPDRRCGNCTYTHVSRQSFAVLSDCLQSIYMRRGHYCVASQER